jgi:hypothetical protein
LNLVKLIDGSYRPAYPSDETASSKVKVGAEVYATHRRNMDFHRKGFALLKLGFENQDKFDEFEIYRQIVTMKAGFVHFVIGKDGKEYPLPQSLSFEKMDAETFANWYSAIREVISKEAQIEGKDIDNELSNYY